jgi:hypothetical protein
MDLAKVLRKQLIGNNLSVQMARMQTLPNRNAEERAVIAGDLLRTFPEHPVYKNQKVMQKILESFASLHPNLAYTQVRLTCVCIICVVL